MSVDINKGFKETNEENNMAVGLTQEDANKLIEMDKHFIDRRKIILDDGFDIERELTSKIGKKLFILSLRQGRIDLKKITYNTRTKVGVPLVRLDIGDIIQHTNPDGTKIIGTHLHVYKEGYADTIAIKIPNKSQKLFKDMSNFVKCLYDFLDFCHVERIKIANQKSVRSYGD
jgi:hypothetical protein